MTTVFYDTNGNFIAMIAAVLYGRDKNCIYWRCIYKTWRIEHFDKKNYKNIRWIQLLCSQIYITPLYWKIHNTFFFIYLTLYYYVFFFLFPVRDKQYVTTLPEEERIAWMWVLLFAFAVPEMGTLIRSARICYFKVFKKPSSTEFFMVR